LLIKNHIDMSLIEKRDSIVQEYKSIEEKNCDNLCDIADKILDVFECEYSILMSKGSPDYTELKEFIMFFVNGNFRKEVKLNIWAAMGFYKQSVLTHFVIDEMRKKFN